MKKLYAVLFAMLCTHVTHGCLSGTLEGLLSDNLLDNFDQFSVILFTLEKNVIRIERYGLDELACDVNRVSKKASKSHCLYKLRLSEQGQSITNIGWNFTDIDNLIIEAQRKKKKTYFGLDWAMLIAQGDAQPQDFMRADVTIREVFNVNQSEADRAPKKAIEWFSSLAISWGIPSQGLTINLILARKIQAAAAVVVPNCFLDPDLDHCVELNKTQLMKIGALVQLKSVTSRPKTDAYVNDQQDDLHDLVTDKPSIISHMYGQMLAKISAAQEYVYNYLWK